MGHLARPRVPPQRYLPSTFRSKEPPQLTSPELIFNINYLGADQASFTLNFSRGASQVIGQYYQLIRLGKTGYRSIMQNLTRTADYLAASVQAMGFILMSQTNGKGLPLVAFRLDPAKKHAFDEFAIAHQLRERGWVVPAYTMAPHSEKLRMMRVVVREDFSRSRCDALIENLKLAMTELHKMDEKKILEHYVEHMKNNGSRTGRTKDMNQHYTDEQHSLRGKHGKTHSVC
jgi:glutamate decarboxylase